MAALVPEANVVFAHGQMHEHELEKLCWISSRGNIDVLVSTIIETGLDIPNANDHHPTPTGWGCRSSTESAVASDVRADFVCVSHVPARQAAA